MNFDKNVDFVKMIYISFQLFNEIDLYDLNQTSIPVINEDNPNQRFEGGFYELLINFRESNNSQNTKSVKTIKDLIYYYSVTEVVQIYPNIIIGINKIWNIKFGNYLFFDNKYNKVVITDIEQY